jgi:hypothetical protein
MQAVSGTNLTAERITDRNEDSLGRPIGIFSSLFGCWHKDLSRPFTSGNVSYRVCTDCGARRRFDTTSFKTLGRYYTPLGVTRP